MWSLVSRLTETEALLKTEQGTKNATKSGATNPPLGADVGDEGKEEEDGEEETLPESTASFYFISKYPCITDNDSSEGVEGESDRNSYEDTQNPEGSEEGSNEPIVFQEKMSNSTSPLFYAFFTSCIQLFIYVIVLINITREGLDFPVGVDVTTRVASVSTSILVRVVIETWIASGGFSRWICSPNICSPFRMHLEILDLFL